MKQYSDYSIPTRPAEKQQQQQIFSYHQGFHQPQFMRQHSHYPMYPTNSASYNPAWLGSPVSGSPVRAFDNYPAFSGSGKYPAVPIKDQSNYPTGSVPGTFQEHYPAVPVKPIPQFPGTAQDNSPVRPMHPGGVGGNGFAATLPGVVAGSPGNGSPQVEESEPDNSSPGFVPNTSDVDQPAAILF